MPLQIDRSGNIPGAMYFRPTMRTSGLFGPDFDEPKFPLQLRITHNFVAQRFASGRDYLNNGLHSTLGSAGNRFFCNASLTSGCSCRPVGDALRHARRTQLLYQEAFGKKVSVGIIAVSNPDYNPKEWWRYGDGVREVIGESIAYIYAEFFFWPGAAEPREKGDGSWELGAQKGDGSWEIEDRVEGMKTKIQKIE